jgi:protein TonB
MGAAAVRGERRAAWLAPRCAIASVLLHGAAAMAFLLPPMRAPRPGGQEIAVGLAFAPVAAAEHAAVVEPDAAVPVEAPEPVAAPAPEPPVAMADAVPVPDVPMEDARVDDATEPVLAESAPPSVPDAAVPAPVTPSIAVPSPLPPAPAPPVAAASVPAPPVPAATPVRPVARPAPSRGPAARASLATTASATPAAPAPPAVARDEGPLLITTPRFRQPPAPPAYPARARELGQEGEVLLDARLDPEGIPQEVVVRRSSGFEMLDRAAIAAVRRWLFEPGRRGGTPVAAWVQVPVRFALR